MPNLATHQKVIKNTLGVSKLAETLGNIFYACKMIEYFRIAFIDLKNFMKKVERQLFKI
ncbi:Uncharacterized protein DB41_FN00080 [Neochlamydia sp. TUME1]|nr:Uncharacterized protein DB41_FN00080 [Neochlamydia sp. TUME1]